MVIRAQLKDLSEFSFFRNGFHLFFNISTSATESISTPNAADTIIRPRKTALFFLDPSEDILDPQLSSIIRFASLIISFPFKTLLLLFLLSQ